MSRPDDLAENKSSPADPGSPSSRTARERLSMGAELKWYDSVWLNNYLAAKNVIARPHALCRLIKRRVAERASISLARGTE
jgi:hypothetical protein